MNRAEKRTIGAKRQIRAVGGYGGGAPPLPPIQNKKPRQQPKPVAPTVPEIARA
jgi:hypothetical protein